MSEKRIRESTAEYKAVAKYAGDEIRLAEASALTGIPRVTLWRWAKRRPPLIRHRVIVGRGGETLMLDKADVLYCAKAHDRRVEGGRGNAQGRTIFDKRGLPYRPQKSPNGDGHK
jgi:hypothetical protein